MAERKWSATITDEKGNTVLIKREPKRLLRSIYDLIAYIEDTPDVQIAQDIIARGRRAKSTPKK